MVGCTADGSALRGELTRLLLLYRKTHSPHLYGLNVKVIGCETGSYHRSRAPENETAWARRHLLAWSEHPRAGAPAAPFTGSTPISSCRRRRSPTTPLVAGNPRYIGARVGSRGVYCRPDQAAPARRGGRLRVGAAARCACCGICAQHFAEEQLIGLDYNKRTIAWCARHFAGIQFIAMNWNHRCRSATVRSTRSTRSQSSPILSERHHRAYAADLMRCCRPGAFSSSRCTAIAT